jgi:hypothetical protein
MHIRCVKLIVWLFSEKKKTNIMKILRLSNLLTRECQEGLIRSPVSLLTREFPSRRAGVGRPSSPSRRCPRPFREEKAASQVGFNIALDD